jgi:hypothetical protein
MWNNGQQLVFNRHPSFDDGQSRPNQSILSYASGIGALVGAYGLQSRAICYMEDQTSPSAKQAEPYKPPSGFGDMLRRSGKPILLHVGAASMAFFCAGAIQTYVTTLSHNEKVRSKKP